MLYVAACSCVSAAGENPSVMTETYRLPLRPRRRVPGWREPPSRPAVSNYPERQRLTAKGKPLPFAVRSRARVPEQGIVLTMPPRSAPRDLRASDGDRERVVAMLGDALADGRLSHEEYSERMPLALAARTLGDLAGLTRDLAAPEHQPVQLEGGQQVAALFTTAVRRGRWAVPGTVTCGAAFGEVVLDFTEAILQERHVVVTVHALFGRGRLIVPSGVEGVMKGNDIIGRHRGCACRRGPT